jgi:hypothetical protein
MVTHTQDPIDPFILRIEELRRIPRPHGLAGLVHDMFLGFFVHLLTLLASLCGQVRTGTLPDPAPAPQAGASPRSTGAPDPSRVPPPDPRPWQSARPEHRPPEAASGGGAMHGLFEQPEMPPEIKQPIAEAPQVDRIVRPPCRMPGVELPAAPPPRQARVRKVKKTSGPTPARPQHMDDGCWPGRRGPAILWTAPAALLRFDSKKAVRGGGDQCVHFVTIQQ